MGSKLPVPEGVRFDERGLVVVIVQDVKTRDLLMVAYMNQAALAQTLATGTMHYWSRSRQELWRKGGTSGHTQTLHGLALDCDGDALLAQVHQAGGACHAGYRSCFYRRLSEDRTRWEVAGRKVFDPDAVYRRPGGRGSAAHKGRA